MASRLRRTIFSLYVIPRQQPPSSTKQKRTDLKIDQEIYYRPWSLLPRNSTLVGEPGRSSKGKTRSNILRALHSGLDPSDFLQYTFRTEEESGSKIHRTDQHSKYFLQGTWIHHCSSIARQSLTTRQTSPLHVKAHQISSIGSSKKGTPNVGM